MNRKQRRTLAKFGGGLLGATSQLQEALGALKKLESPIQQVEPQFAEVSRIAEEVRQMVAAVGVDLQKMSGENEILRGLLFDRDPALKLAYERAMGHDQVSMGAMVPSPAPCPQCGGAGSLSRHQE